MAIIAQNLSIGTVAQRIISRDDNPQHVILHNHEHANNHEIYVGLSNVTTTTGLHIRHTETIQIVIAPGDELWAIADGDARDLRVLIRNV
jgi:hypothetical protein